MQNSRTRRPQDKNARARRARQRSSLFLGALLPSAVAFAGVGCGPALEIAEEGVRLEALDGRELDGISPVSRLAIEGLSDVALEDIWLVRGEVSSASSSRLARRDVPDSIESARQSVTAWREETSLVVAPAHALDAGETYSVVILGVGHVGQVVVASDPVIFLERQVTTTMRVGDFVPYCATSRLAEDLDGQAVLAEMPEGVEV